MTTIPSTGSPSNPGTPNPPPKLLPAQVVGTRDIAKVAPQAVAASNAKSKADAPVKTTPPPDELKKLVGEMQSKVSSQSSDLQFTIDQDSGKTVVKVTDSATKEVVWQFPSEEALQVSKELAQFQKGALVSRKA